MWWSLCAFGVAAAVAQHLEPHPLAAADRATAVFHNSDKRSVLDDAAVDLEPLLQTGFNGFGGGSSPQLLYYRGYGRGLTSGYGGFGAPPGNDFQFGLQQTLDGFAEPPANDFEYAANAARFGGGSDARYSFDTSQFPLEFPVRFDGPETVPGSFPGGGYTPPPTPSQESAITQPHESAITPPQESAIVPPQSGSSNSNDVPQPSQQQSFPGGDGLREIGSTAEESRTNTSSSSDTSTTTEAPADLILELRPPPVYSVPLDYSKIPSTGNSPYGDSSVSGPVDSVPGGFRNGRGGTSDTLSTVAVNLPGHAATGNFNNLVAGSLHPDPNPIPVNVPVSGAAVSNSNHGSYNIFSNTAVSHLTPSASNTYNGQLDSNIYAVNGNNSPGSYKSTIPAGLRPVSNPTAPNNQYNAPILIPDNLYNSIFTVPLYDSGPNTFSATGNVKLNPGNVNADLNSILSNDKRQSSNNVPTPVKIPLYYSTNDYKKFQ